MASEHFCTVSALPLSTNPFGKWSSLSLTFGSLIFTIVSAAVVEGKSTFSLLVVAVWLLLAVFDDQTRERDANLFCIFDKTKLYRLFVYQVGDESIRRKWNWNNLILIKVEEIFIWHRQENLMLQFQIVILLFIVILEENKKISILYIV